MLLIIDHAQQGALTLFQPRWSDRLLARLLADRLDRALAGGAAPESSPRLALRAQRLVSHRTRSQLADALERLVVGAQQPWSPRQARLPPSRRPVRRATPALCELERRLRSPDPVTAAGVARVSELLRDGSGPLYHPHGATDLPSRVAGATAALDAIALEAGPWA